MSVWSWLKLTVCLWLLRKAVKATGWLLAFAAVIAAWPLTLVIAAGYLAAWWRARPPTWLRRGAAWSLIMPAPLRLPGLKRSIHNFDRIES